jgi:iron complex transport system permease protein
LGWYPPITIFAFLGALSVLALELAIARRGLRMEGAELVLLGVMLAAIFSSLTLLVEYFMTPNDLARSSRWLMGSVEAVGFSVLALLVPVTIALIVVSIRKGRELDLLYLGEELARSRGLDYSKCILRWYLMVALGISVAVSFCGPIGFVGILVPHFTRQFFGGRPSANLAPAVFWGGVFLVSCDALARTLMAPVELPVGILTALLGGPAFLVVMLRDRGRG